MKSLNFKKYLVVLSFLGFCGSGWATPYPIPDPLPPGTPPGVTVGADIDGSGLFTPEDTILNIEIFDFVENQTGSGTAFGFYFDSDPSTLIPIFDFSDASFNRASIDFGSGQVTDLDLGLPQSNFSQQAGPIGFYMSAPLFGTRYTQKELNGGDDLTAAYALSGELPDGTSLLGSYLLGFTRAPGVLSPLYASIAGPMTPSAVPLPGAIFLWLTGLAGLALFRRRLAADSTATAAR